MRGSIAVGTRLRSIPWRVVLLASYVGVNLIFIPQKILLGPEIPVDWQLFRQLPDAVVSDTVYDIRAPDIWFAWSPVAAWVMAGAALIGYWPWLTLHVAAVFLLRSPLLIGLVLVSYGFWFDAAQGNTVTFALVAGMLAVSGSRIGALSYLALLFLMPRPLMAPLAVWLLWRDRTLWRPAAAIFTIHAASVFATGDALAWVANMLAYELAPGITIGPTAWIGRWWLVLGIPLAALLTWRGYVGWAGLAVSPYVTPQYVLWPLLDLVPKDHARREGTRDSRTRVMCAKQG